jgi:NADH:ubiquinone oxidoreductase subunit K
MDPRGEIYALIVITVAAAESVVGLGLLISMFRLKKKINFFFFNNFKF